MGKINTNNYPNRPVSSYQDDDMFILQDNGGETYTTNVGDIKNLADSRIKLEGVQVNGTDLPISGKKVNVDISGKTDLKVIAFPFHDPEPGEPSMGFFKGAYVTYNGKLYEFTQEHQGAWNPSHVREVDVDGMYVRAGNGGYDTGRYSTTEGHSTRAEGEASHAEGLETIANSDNQHVEGKYNVADTDDEYALIVGNGTADNARSNAMTLDWDGNLEVSGDVENGNGEKISDKADKVTNATSGHLAGLDSNGNLTDSGVSPTEDVTVEGNPVTFESPFEQDAKSVVVSVKPIQAGSGTPSPENIRPISGIDEVEIGVTGKNLFDVDTCSLDSTQGIAISNHTIVFTNNFYIAARQTIYLHEGEKITLSYHLQLTSGSAFVSCRLGENIIIYEYRPTATGDYSSTFTAPTTGTYYFIFSGATDDATGVFSKIQVEPGTQATSYEPYNPNSHTTTIPLPSTLYDGDVDVTEGSGDENKALKVLSSSDPWVKYDNPSIPSGRHVYYIDAGLPGSKDPLSDDNNGHLVMSSNVYDINTTALNTILTYSVFSIGIGLIGVTRLATIGINTDIDNLQDFKDWVDSVGIQIMYELATPTTISFTPADVELLEGTNVVSTNAEKVAVTYGRSLWQDINELKTDTEGKLNKSDVADVEGDTASRAYSVNEFMLRSDGFYRVTQPIASGASITASNTTKTTIGAVLTALLNA